MPINRDIIYTPSEIDDLVDFLNAYLGDDPAAELGIDKLTIYELAHFVSTVH